MKFARTNMIGMKLVECNARKNNQFYK